MNRLLNAFVKLFIRMFLPGIARSLEEEGQFDFQDKTGGQAGTDPSLCLSVEDNGADTTVICFAGMAVLYAAMPKFEFRKTLLDVGGHYNFIWVRDVHRSLYNVALGGTPDGYGFYARIIGDALAKLGSTHNVAIGASGGGAAAFAFSGVLPVGLVIAFNPAFPLDIYASARNRWRVFLDGKKMLRHPGDYFEVVLVTLGAYYIWKRVCRLVGRANTAEALDWYLRKNPPARAVLFYSDHCLPDAEQIRSVDRALTVTPKPVNSGRHNCMGELKERGELGPLIHKEIQTWLADA
ncbi:MAG TPA: hypothetical protein PLO37_09500 [Candidatus Hydrogenedentes bacterium]|nr:hypothetical protein [Candidatus Hydrogenedentota bacterium]HPG67066.1 hypothetical protein [Candidatus Hydrogenedentota bacterium]